MRDLLKSKKSAEMTIGTIIIIILALVVLIFLIYSFMRGGGSLMDTLNNFFAGGPNVDTIKNACQAACTTQSSYAFCEEVRTLKLTDKDSRLGSCKTFSTLGVAGIAGCPDITCANVPKTCREAESTATWQKTCSGEGNDLTAQAKNSENNNIKETPYCCKAVSTTIKCLDTSGQVLCAVGKCAVTNQAQGQFSDTTQPLPLCCKVACLP
jgi:hypothetical protein